MTPEQKARRRVVARRYEQSCKGRAIALRLKYQARDGCDLSAHEIAEVIARPCHYCGTTVEARGLDRICNGKAHLRGNILPACFTCNRARGDSLTVEEMLLVGKVIRDIRAVVPGGLLRGRPRDLTQSADRP